MKNKFASFTVYATVVLTMSSLAILSLTVSDIMVESASSDHEEVVTLPRHPERQCAHDEALAACVKGVQFIFSTVEHELTKHKHCSSNVESGRAGSFAEWATVYDVIFSQMPKGHPLACSQVREGAYLMMDKAVNAIYTGITAATSNTSSDISSELQTLQDTAICGLKTAATRVYAYLRNQKNDLKTNPAIYRYEQNTIGAAATAVPKMFGAIRILMAAISSETGIGSKDHLGLVTVFRESVVKTNAVNWVQNVFDTIDILFPVGDKKQV